jgi:hypothetical protein
MTLEDVTAPKAHHAEDTSNDYITPAVANGSLSCAACPSWTASRRSEVKK